LVIDQLYQTYGRDEYEFEIVQMKTTGDHILDKPLSQIGSKSLFTKELEEALIAHEVDFIVHSLKDLPTTLPAGCCIGSILKREDPSDAIVLRDGLSLSEPFDALSGDQLAVDSDGNARPFTIGTSSHRRISQIKKMNPKSILADCRGNINTRFAKLDGEHTWKEGQTPIEYDLLILATAGLVRGGFGTRISQRLDANYQWYYAVGQGALAIECRANDEKTIKMLRPLNCVNTVCETLAERSLMLKLEGGCSVPIGVRCNWTSALDLKLSAAIFSLDGTETVEDAAVANLPSGIPNVMADHYADGLNHGHGQGDGELNLAGVAPPKCPVLIERYTKCVELGTQLAQTLSDRGGKTILDAIKAQRH